MYYCCMTNPSKTSLLAISVFTRHQAGCPKKTSKNSRFCKTCKCRKWLYFREDGKSWTVSAKTRSWEKAQEQANAELAKRDRVSLALQEIKDQEAAKRAAEAAKVKQRVTVPDALAAWDRECHPKHSTGSALKIKTFTRKVTDWAKKQKPEIVFVDEVTRLALGQWKGKWSLKATEIDNRMGDSTQEQFQGKLQEFFRWAYNTELVDRDPAASLLTISVEDEQTMPLTPEQFEELLAAIPRYDAAQPAGYGKYGSELRSLFIVQRWTGLRINDVLLMSRSALKEHRISLITRKTKAKFDEFVPDQVVEALSALQPRKGVHPDYYFWSHNCTEQSLVSKWCTRIAEFSRGFLSFRDDAGQPMSFHSHMLRDTFAVEMLLDNQSYEEVARWLTHKSSETTKKHYDPFVKRRKAQLDVKKLETLVRQGARFSHLSAASTIPVA
jgi:integrase